MEHGKHHAFFLSNPKRLRIWATLHCIFEKQSFWKFKKQEYCPIFVRLAWDHCDLKKTNQKRKNKAIFISKEVFSKILSFYSVQKPTFFFVFTPNHPTSPKKAHTHTHKRLFTDFFKPITKLQHDCPVCLWLDLLATYSLTQNQHKNTHGWGGVRGKKRAQKPMVTKQNSSRTTRKNVSTNSRLTTRASLCNQTNYFLQWEMYAQHFQHCNKKKNTRVQVFLYRWFHTKPPPPLEHISSSYQGGGV